MKTTIFKYLMIVLLMFTYSASYSQSGISKVYITKDVTIDYINGFKQSVNFDSHKVSKVPYIVSIENINRIFILNDSLLRISSDNTDDVEMNINKISGVEIKSGSNLGLGIGLGALVGLGIGVGIGASNETNGWFHGLATAGGGVIGLLTGALFGGIIGGNTTSYETYQIGDNIDKQKELERILKINKKQNSF